MESTAAAEFKLSITKALGDQLAETLDRLQPQPLNETELKKVQERSGVYELFLDGQRVYVGKAARSLRARLTQHLNKLSGRTGLTLNQVTFVCVYVDEDLDSAAPESLLIKKYRANGDVPWNTNGFGNKDPGRERDTTVLKENHFDALYPIDLSIPLELGDDRPAIEFLESLKKSLPYNFRYDTTPEAKRIYDGIIIPGVSGIMTAREAFQHTTAHLPLGWQITALCGYVICYPETKPYKNALFWWRRDPSRGVIETVGPHKMKQESVITENAEGGVQPR